LLIKLDLDGVSVTVNADRMCRRMRAQQLLCKTFWIETKINRVSLGLTRKTIRFVREMQRMTTKYRMPSWYRTFIAELPKTSPEKVFLKSRPSEMNSVAMINIKSIYANRLGRTYIQPTASATSITDTSSKNKMVTNADANTSVIRIEAQNTMINRDRSHTAQVRNIKIASETITPYVRRYAETLKDTMQREAVPPTVRLYVMSIAPTNAEYRFMKYRTFVTLMRDGQRKETSSSRVKKQSYTRSARPDTVAN